MTEWIIYAILFLAAALALTGCEEGDHIVEQPEALYELDHPWGLIPTSTNSPSRPTPAIDVSSRPRMRLSASPRLPPSLEARRGNSDGRVH